jgi:hypothetical protein
MPLDHLKLSALIAIYSSGFLLVIAIVTGGWKYRHIRTTSEHRAPTYVSIAHQAALAYSFSCLVVATLAQLSAWPEWVNLTAVILLLSQFYFATIVYILHGFDATMKNQFATPHRIGSRPLSPAMVRGSMWVLFGLEFLGAVILLAGLGASSLSST